MSRGRQTSVASNEHAGGLHIVYTQKHVLKRQARTLETGALVGELADAVQDEVDNFLADGVVATSVVVGGVFLACVATQQPRHTNG